MKSLQKLGLLFAASLLSAGVAQANDGAWEAQEVRFSYSSFYSFYSCDYVEGEVEDALEALGARDIDVTCRGGLPHSRVNWVTANFSSAQEAAGDGQDGPQWNTVSLRFNEACDFHERMMRQILSGFNVSDVSKRGSCRDSAGRLRYEIQLLN